MQFYLDGYVPGDPDILAAAPDAEARGLDLPETVDVLIVGAGPAGMLLSAQLSTFPGIRTRLIERREGPLQVGQADGVAWCAGFGRLGGVGGPLIGGLLIASGLSIDTIFFVLAGLALLGVVLTLLVPASKKAVTQGVATVH